MRRASRVTIAWAFSVLAGSRVEAQNAVTLTVTGGASSVFPPPLPSAFGSYAYNPVALTFTAATSNGSAVSQTWTVQVCANNANPTLGNGKPLTDLEWTPAGQSAYRAIAPNTDCNAVASPATVVSSVLTPVGGNASLSGGILFRMRLNVTDAGPTYGTPLRLYLVVTAP